LRSRLVLRPVFQPLFILHLSLSPALVSPPHSFDTNTQHTTLHHTAPHLKAVPCLGLSTPPLLPASPLSPVSLSPPLPSPRHHLHP
jgi:hypothetical protein